MIIWMSGVLRRTVWGTIDWHSDNLSGSRYKSQVNNNCGSSVDGIKSLAGYWPDWSVKGFKHA